MIAYLDTSAIVKLYVVEEGSPAARRLVDTARVVATSKVAYAEARAAFARGYREGILQPTAYELIVGSFAADWPKYLRLEVSDEVLYLAGSLAEKHALRGFDAIHLASALILARQARQPLVVGCWDARLRTAARACELEVMPPQVPGN